MRIRRAMLRSEFDHLIWRKRRMDERLDVLAAEIETLTLEMAVEEIAPFVIPQQQTGIFMEIL